MMNEPGYEQLADVLKAAFDQAARGKGKERHANGLPFHEQRIQGISSLLNSDRGLAYQAIKKITEGMDLPTPEAVEKELLGAIVYTAAIIVWRRQNCGKAPVGAGGQTGTDFKRSSVGGADFKAQALEAGGGGLGYTCPLPGGCKCPPDAVYCSAVPCHG